MIFEKVMACIGVLGGGAGVVSLVRELRRRPRQVQIQLPAAHYATEADLSALKQLLRDELRKGLDEINDACDRRHDSAMAKTEQHHREMRDVVNGLKTEVAVTMERVDGMRTRSRR